MKIGIGVTTYNRPKHLELLKKQTIHWQREGIYWVHIADDSKERKGIAFRKNECLRALKECDFVFLMDDDCFPIKEGWVNFFIEAHKSSGQHHFLYLKETPTIKKTNTFLERADELSNKAKYIIDSYNNSAGCFMFLTKEAIEKVGAFDERFDRYGWEHSNFTKRIHMAGLTPMGENLCPSGAGEYIYSMDIDHHLPFNKQVNHKSSLKPKEALECIAKGQEHFNKPITEIFIPL